MKRDLRLFDFVWLLCPVLGSGGCQSDGAAASNGPGRGTPDAANLGDGVAPGGAHLPLVLVADVDLPGGATRFDYQDVDPALGHLVASHMNDGSVLILDLKDGSVLKELTGIPVARGVVVAGDVGLTFVTSAPSSLVVIDNQTMSEKTRVGTGSGPDGVGWDPVDKVVGVSDQGDGALSLIPDSGSGTRQQVKLGSETGNVVFDKSRGWFWITVVGAAPPDQLVGVDPLAAQVKKTIDMPAGCGGAHGLRLHPDGKSAFVACEVSSTLFRVDLDSSEIGDPAATGGIPDVMNIDTGLGWLYVASESGVLTVFDINQPGVSLVGQDHPGDNSHTVAIDQATHRVFFPLMTGPNGTPVLRIMRPSGIGDHGARPGDAGDTCNPFGKSTCGAGRVCCFSSDPGVCTEPSACTSPLQSECWLPGDCGPGKVCCGTFEPPLAGPGTPITDASLHAKATLFCTSTCAPPNVQLCTNTSDCQGGRTCAPAPEGGNSGVISIAVEAIGICTNPEAGAP